MIREFSTGEVLILLRATQWTVVLSLIAFLGGSVFGIVIALLRTAPLAPARALAVGYVQLFQGTPLLMQLVLVFFGVSILGPQIDAWSAAAIGLTLYTSAFLGEIWRGCIQAIPKTQWEASTSLGLSHGQQLGYVILPQAMRIALPPTVGFLVQVIKSTSLASIIGFTELTRAGQLVNNATYSPLLVFSLVSVIYFALCWPLSLASQYLERRLDVVRATGRRL
jgi:polar amino acid transport system permease protein